MLASKKFAYDRYLKKLGTELKVFFRIKSCLLSGVGIYDELPIR